MKKFFNFGVVLLFITAMVLCVVGCNKKRYTIIVEESRSENETTTEAAQETTTAEEVTTEERTQEATTEPATTEPVTTPAATVPSTESVPKETEKVPNHNQGDKVNFEGFTISNELRNISSGKVNVGGNGRDEHNRPIYYENLQNAFGDKYNSVFIGDENSKTIYLTFTMGYELFNDGVANTDVIMDILKRKNVPAMFFVDGGYTKYRADICKRIVENGFVLGCHGFDHPSEGVANYNIEAQLEDAKKIYNRLYEITGVEPYYYRFGSGIWNERALALLSELGFRNVFFSFTYKDWDTSAQPDKTTAMNTLLNGLHNGEILYLHTVSNTNVAILEEFIDEARARGYEFGLIE